MLTAPRHAAEPAPAYGWAPYDGRARWLPSRWGWLLLGWAAVAVGTWALWGTTVDDTFITFRYAQNVADGLGLTWNPGQDPVEGFTNFAWMAWHVPFAWAGVPLPVVAKLTAAACATGVVWILAREPRTTTGVAVGLGCFVLFLPTWVHVDAGLETVPVALVALRSLVLGARVADERPVSSWELPVLLLLAGLLRPEGVLAVLPALLLWLRSARRDPSAWAWTGAAVLAGAVYFGWRWAHFGYLLPNTFYVKAGQDAQLTGEWLQVTSALLLPLLVLAGALLTRRATASAGVLAVCTVAAFWVVPALTHPAMDYLSRFAWHAVPVLCLAAAWALDRAEPRRVAAGVALVTVGWIAIAGVAHTDARSMVNYGGDLDRAHGAIGRGLAAADVPLEARTVATSDAGAIPYFSGWQTLDYIGLNDEPIAHGADVTQAVRAASPTVIVVTSDTVPSQARSHGLDVPAATPDYVQVAAGQMRDAYYQVVFVKPEFAAQVAGPVNDELARAAAQDSRYDVGFRRWLDRLF